MPAKEKIDPNAPGNAISTGADAAQSGFKATVESDSKQAWRKDKMAQRAKAGKTEDG